MSLLPIKKEVIIQGDPKFIYIDISMFIKSMIFVQMFQFLFESRQRFCSPFLHFCEQRECSLGRCNCLIDIIKINLNRRKCTEGSFSCGWNGSTCLLPQPHLLGLHWFAECIIKTTLSYRLMKSVNLNLYSYKPYKAQWFLYVPPLLTFRKT